MNASATQQFNSLEDVFFHELEDIYDAEKRLTNALPKMRDSASSPELKECFDQHLQETEGHVGRLEKVFQELGRKPSRENCEAMKGLIREGEEIIQSQGDASAHDAALIAAAQRVEHYEIAAYGTARTLARQLDHSDLASRLEETLNEEKNADKMLNDIAESRANPGATG